MTVEAANYEGLAGFQIHLLPARCAYLVQAGSQTGFRRAVQEATAR